MASTKFDGLEDIPGRKNIADSIASQLREAIVKGLLQAGEELNQVEIAERFAVSRIPVREALKMLESEGLIRSTPHKRAVVSPLDEESLINLYEIRSSLECLALRKGAENLLEEDVAHLKGLIAQMLTVTDHLEWMELNHTFHDYIYDKSGNQPLCVMIHQLRSNTERYFWVKSTSIVRNTEAAEEHMSILSACVQKDPDVACSRLTEHLNRTLNGLLKSLRERTPRVMSST